MAKDSREPSGASPAYPGEAWFDPIEVAIRDRVRGFIEELVEAELDDALGRSRYQRAAAAHVASDPAGYRHGRRARQLLGSFGAVTIRVPRARLNEADGMSREWRSEALRGEARSRAKPGKSATKGARRSRRSVVSIGIVCRGMRRTRLQRTSY